MNIDALIAQRKDAKQNRNYVESDRIRNLLDEHLVFIYDHPDGTETVYHYPSKVFDRKPKDISNRKYAELLFEKERLAEKRLESWIYTNTQLNPPRIGYRDNEL